MRLNKRLLLGVYALSLGIGALCQSHGAERVLKPSVTEDASYTLEIVHPCTDYGFKRAFKNPKVAMGFLNHILGLSGDEVIHEVQYLNTEFQSSDPLGRHFTVDVLCQTKNGRRFLLEMQNDFRSDYADKALTELCRLIAHWDAQVVHQKVDEHARKRARANATLGDVKDFWDEIRTAIVVMITNKVFPAQEMKGSQPTLPQMEPDIINSYRLTHMKQPTRFLGNMDARAVLVMLGNFTKKESELSTDLERWLYALKDASLASGVSRIPTYKMIQDIRQVVGGEGADVGLKEFYHGLDKAVVHSAGELEHYERSIVEANAILTHRMQEERAKGVAQGKIEGKLEGKLEGEKAAKIEIARGMLADEEPIAKIVKYTGLTEDEIKGID